jgi:hypothetical protein
MIHGVFFTFHKFQHMPLFDFHTRIENMTFVERTCDAIKVAIDDVCNSRF